jgi:hypothetical protein
MDDDVSKIPARREKFVSNPQQILFRLMREINIRFHSGIDEGKNLRLQTIPASFEKKRTCDCGSAL